MRKGYLIIIPLLLCSLGIQAQKLKFVNHTEAGVLAGEVGTQAAFSFQTFNGLSIPSARLIAGLTAGADLYSEVKIFPIALGTRYMILNRGDVIPFLSMDLGYGFDWLEKETETISGKGGWMINPVAGISIKTARAARISLSVGYKNQSASSSRNESQIFYREDEQFKFRRISLKLGAFF